MNKGSRIPLLLHIGTFGFAELRPLVATHWNLWICRTTTDVSDLFAIARQHTDTCSVHDPPFLLIHYAHSSFWSMILGLLFKSIHGTRVRTAERLLPTLCVSVVFYTNSMLTTTFEPILHNTARRNTDTTCNRRRTLLYQLFNTTYHMYMYMYVVPWKLLAV